ncbi:MAG: WbqC family protein [Candidatus Eremiobacteraeota bacterium]|nr:WbqC family protein [Candidatus Eremiobacteraeota bacterium]
MPDRIVSIHQPNFFPWLGLFDKIARSQLFVIWDSAPSPNQAGWLNRVRLLQGGQPKWVTAPLVNPGARTQDELRLDETQRWRERLLRTLKIHYGKARHFHKVQPFIEHLLCYPTESLTRLNGQIIYELCNKLGLQTEIMAMSRLGIEAEGTDLLVKVTEALGGEVYLAGGNSGHLLPEDFAQRGLELRFQNYRPGRYDQVDNTIFVPGLSILDALMNCGWQATAAMLGR